MIGLDDRDVAKPPYDEGPNKQELVDKPIPEGKLVRVLADLLMDEEETVE